MIGRVIVGLLLMLVTAPHADAASAERIFYLNNGIVLQGCIYKPATKGPFPTVVFIQNAIKPLPTQGAIDPLPELGKFYTSRGYALFLPGRHNLKSADEGKSTEKPKANPTEKEFIEGYEQQAETIFAGIVTLKAQDYVDTRRIFVTGYGSGGTISLFLAEKDVDVRGYVVFSPAASLWKQMPLLQTRLKTSVRNAKAPIYLIQPLNDFGLEPTEVLGKELDLKGAPNQNKVFASYGKNATEANGFAIHAPDVWGPDVLSFFAAVSK